MPVPHVTGSGGRADRLGVAGADRPPLGDQCEGAGDELGLVARDPHHRPPRLALAVGIVQLGRGHQHGGGLALPVHLQEDAVDRAPAVSQGHNRACLLVKVDGLRLHDVRSLPQSRRSGVVRQS